MAALPLRSPAPADAPRTGPSATLQAQFAFTSRASSSSEQAYEQPRRRNSKPSDYPLRAPLRRAARARSLCSRPLLSRVHRRRPQSIPSHLAQSHTTSIAPPPRRYHGDAPLVPRSSSTSDRPSTSTRPSSQENRSQQTRSPGRAQSEPAAGHDFAPSQRRTSEALPPVRSPCCQSSAAAVRLPSAHGPFLGVPGGSAHLHHAMNRPFPDW